jgi:16S rRNA (uracil1498-N3)-methyltransferase
MSAPRFHVPAPGLGGAVPGAEFELPGPVAHHALRVLRLREGDELALFDGTGGEYRCRMLAAGAGGRASARIEAFDPAEREARVAITLVQSLVAQDKLEWVIEKAVELGATAVMIVAAQRSSVRMESSREARRLERWASISASAAEQCGRTRIPAVQWGGRLESALCALPAGGARYALDPLAAAGLQAAWGRHTAHPGVGADATCCVGPEGGFTGEELALLSAAGFERVRLGPRVLRTETAGVVAMATLLAGAGEFA